MMVRPLEFQDLFAKTQAAERVAELQKAQLENQQRQAAAATQHRASEKQRKATPAHRADEVILHKEQGEKKQKDKKKRSDDQSDETESQEPAETNTTESTDETDSPPHLDLTA